MYKLLTPSVSPRSFMLIPPPRPAITDIAPATSPMVPIFAVSARCRICEVSFAIRSHRSEEHTSELQSRLHLVCRLLLEKKNEKKNAKRVVATKQRDLKS